MLNEQQFQPLPVPSEPGAYNQQVGEMANRIVQTYNAAGPEEHAAGEHFYSREAHGAARSIAANIHPDSAMGQLIRSNPHPSERVALGPVEQVQQNAQFEHRVNQAAGVIARLSPQTDWGQNVTQAHEAFHMPEQALNDLITNKRDMSGQPNKKGEYPRAPVVDEQGNKMALNNQPSASIIKAVEIARGEDPEKYVKSEESQRVKIGSFKENVAHPDTSPHVTVDFRAHDIAAGQLLSTGTNRGISKTPKAGSTRAGTKAAEEKARYNMFEDAHKRATDIINDKRRADSPSLIPNIPSHDVDLQPKQVQAVTWWADKNAQDTAMGGKKVGTAGNLHVGAGTKNRGDLGKPVGQ